jgi:hypothetical protein
MLKAVPLTDKLKDDNAQTEGSAMNAKPHDGPDAKAELVNVNALYSLLEDRYSKRVSRVNQSGWVLTVSTSAYFRRSG